MDNASKSKDKIHVRKECLLEQCSKPQRCKEVQGILVKIAAVKLLNLLE
jgi:hypothetical protein